MIQFLLGLILLAVGAAVCIAQQVNTPIDNLWIARGPSAAADPHHLYGPSSPSCFNPPTTSMPCTWAAQQWGNYPPSLDMSPFASIACSSVVTTAAPPLTNCFRAAGTNHVMTQFTSGGNVVAQIQSQGLNQPCFNGTITPGTSPESDAMIAPIGTAPAGYPGYPAGIIANPNLSTLTALTYSATVKLKYVAQNVANACPPVVNTVYQSFTLMMAASFSTGTQTLFYQLAIARLGYVYSNVGNGYFAVTNPYGFGDDISWYGANQPTAMCGGCSNQMPALNAPVTYSVNILPRVLAAITAGAGNGVDQTLSDWTIGGMYVGHVVYGNIGGISEWSNIGYAGTTLAAQSIGLSATSVTLPGTANAGSFVATVNVTTSGAPYMGTLSLGGADAAKFSLSNGGMYPTNLMIGPTNLCASGSPCTYNITITAP